ncbi:tRNA (cytosine-5-)-methyltransferase, partial [Asbolus verrucosus]
SGVEGEVKTSIDINPVANSIYQHNFPDVKLLHRNIQGLTPKFINKLGVDTILMSPPCQPFTRNGLQADVEDERTKSFVHILDILPLLNIEKILIENVKGFETSQMRELLIATLTKCGFVYQEFILNPTQIGVPNSRHRYYCLASKSVNGFPFETGPLKSELPSSSESAEKENCFKISQIIEHNVDLNPFYLDDKILRKHLNVLDICFFNSINSCCFTKAYGRYIEGTGSVFTEKSEEFVQEIYKQAFGCEAGSEEYLRLARQLNLRFFTPREVCRLMCFPETFTFPK